MLKMYNLFTNEKIIIYFLMLIYSTLWLIYNSCIRPKNPTEKHLLGCSFIKISKEFEIFFPYINRDGKILYQQCIDGWSLVHFLIYFSIGLLLKNEFIFLLIISITIEFYEYLSKARSKLSDIYFNMLGYFCGVRLFTINNKFLLNIIEKYIGKNEIIILIISYIVIYSLLTYDRICKIKNIKKEEKNGIKILENMD